MAKTNKTGRRKSGPPFLQLFRYMLGSPAWRSLSPAARAVYIEVAQLYDGKNNGHLAMGVRTASERARVNKDTASKSFATLIERGFLEPAQAGAFNQNARPSDRVAIDNLSLRQDPRAALESVHAMGGKCRTTSENRDTQVRNEGTRGVFNCRFSPSVSDYSGGFGQCLSPLFSDTYTSTP